MNKSSYVKREAGKYSKSKRVIDDIINSVYNHPTEVRKVEEVMSFLDFERCPLGEISAIPVIDRSTEIKESENVKSDYERIVEETEIPSLGTVINEYNFNDFILFKPKNNWWINEFDGTSPLYLLYQISRERFVALNWETTIDWDKSKLDGIYNPQVMYLTRNWRKRNYSLSDVLHWVRLQKTKGTIFDGYEF